MVSLKRWPDIDNRQIPKMYARYRDLVAGGAPWTVIHKIIAFEFSVDPDAVYELTTGWGGLHTYITSLVRRHMACILRKKGFSIAQIADIIDCSRQNVYKILARDTFHEKERKPEI